MRLNRISLHNFGPYHGEHEVDLRVSKATPLIFIYGENERGKTSFANAVRWCLYKEVLESDGSRVPSIELMNWEALDGGNANMSVTLEFTHNDHEYKLERHIQASHRPSSDADLEWRSYFRCDGTIQPSDVIDRTIRDMLSPKISRFFLFDGEMLNQYKALLRQTERNAIIVRQSIEQILGVPALTMAMRAVEDLLRETEARQLAETKARHSHERVVADVQQKQDHVNALKADLENATNLRDRLEQEREELRARRSAYSESEADLRRLDQIDDLLTDNDKRQGDARARLAELLADNWHIPLERHIAARLTQIETQIAKLMSARVAAAEASRLKRAAAESIANSRCAFCGQQLSESSVAHLEAHLGMDTPTDPSLSMDVESLAAQAATLRSMVPRFDLVREVDRERRRLVIDRRRLEDERDEIRERVRDENRDDIAEIEDAYDKCVEQLAQVNSIIAEHTERLAEAEARLRMLRAKMRQLPNTNERLAAEAETYALLKDLFQRAIDGFRRRVKVEVQSAANDIHRNLSTEPEYEGLKIDDNYGLSLYNSQGRNILRRSAGSEHVVAMALIGALNRCSTREGPLVMDTPFGRLDRGHRRNILGYLPRMGTQVILLVQSGEIERDRDLEDIREYIQREYQIERDGASDRSRIVPLVTTGAQ